MATQKYPKPSEMPRVGPGGVILDVPENREFLLAVEVAPELTLEHLLDIATLYWDNRATRPIADRLAAKAMSMFVSSPSVNKAMETIAKTEVEWYG